MYENTLTQIGLDGQQALIYEVLLKNGPLPASKISQKSPFKRPLTYKILEELQDVGLVEKREDPGKVAVFHPLHPQKLGELLDEKIKKAEQAKYALGSVIGQLTSDFNLISGKPGVQFFEGPAGVEKVIFDNLTSKTEILSYLDMGALDKYIPEINQRYIAARKRLGIKKRNLVNDTPENRERLAGYHRYITEVRLMKFADSSIHFASMIQIYDDKISYFTLDPERMIGVIIQDKNIVDMHRQLYLYTWQFAKPLPGQDTPTTPPTAIAAGPRTESQA